MSESPLCLTDPTEIESAGYRITVDLLAALEAAASKVQKGPMYVSSQRLRDEILSIVNESDHPLRTQEISDQLTRRKIGHGKTSLKDALRDLWTASLVVRDETGGQAGRLPSAVYAKVPPAVVPTQQDADEADPSAYAKRARSTVEPAPLPSDYPNGVEREVYEYLMANPGSYIPRELAGLMGRADWASGVGAACFYLVALGHIKAYPGATEDDLTRFGPHEFAATVAA